MLLPGLLLACDRPAFDATIALAPAEAPLARALTVVADVPVTVRVALDDGTDVRTIAFDAPATARVVPILGFRPGSSTAVTVTVTADRGSVTEGFDVESPALPEDFPIVEVLALDQDRVEPGWTLLDAESTDEAAVPYVLMLDEAGAVAWWWAPPFRVSDVRLGVEGHLWALGDGRPREVDVLGNVVREWAGGYNHELFVTADGFLTLRDDTVIVPDLPTTYADPSAVAPAAVLDGTVVELGFDGAIRREWPLTDRLQTSRIGYGSLEVTDDGFDWAHANAVIPDDDGGLVVSVRNQDALVRLDAGGEVTWILGTPSGWASPYADRLLAPVGTPFAWPYHAHAPALAGGLLYVFDNESWGFNPYESPILPPPSRVVAYCVEGGTVSQELELTGSTTGPLHSEILGDADPLPLTGDVLADYGFLDREGDVRNADRGWGLRSGRLVEYAPTGEVVLDVRIRTDAAVDPVGRAVYRAERLGSPWAESGPAAGRWD
jgi:hypothetical protein